MKNIFIVIVSIIFLSSCVTERRYDRAIDHYYLKKKKSCVLPQKNEMAFELVGGSDTLNSYSFTKRTKFVFVPAIVYYFSKQKNLGLLNKNIYINDFNNYYKEVIANSDLTEDLKSRIIEIEFKKIPNKVNFQYTQHTVYLLIYVWAAVYQLKFTNDTQELEVHFKIKDANGKVLKEGDLNEIVPKEEGYGSAFQTVKGFMEDNLLSFDVATELAMKRMVSSIIREIE